MTTSSELLAQVVAVLVGDQAGANPPAYPTSAEDRVYGPGDWPTQNDQYPILKARVQREYKQSLGRSGGPQFTVTTTIRIIGEVSALVQVDDAGADAAAAALFQLQREVELAVINSYPLTPEIQQIVSIDSQLSYSSEAATHLAGIQIDVGLEIYQGPEDFAPIAAGPLNQISLSDTSLTPSPGFLVDLNQ